jgi:hypothetical protein
MSRNLLLFAAAILASFAQTSIARAQTVSAFDRVKIEFDCSAKAGLVFQIGYLSSADSTGYVLTVSAFSLDSFLEGGDVASITLVAADGDLKKVSDADIKKIDARKFKEDQVGKDNVSKYNIYKDKDGKVVLVPVNKDSGLSNVETGMTWDEVLEDYPAKKKGAEFDASVEEIAEEIQE